MTNIKLIHDDESTLSTKNVADIPINTWFTGRIVVFSPSPYRTNLYLKTCAGIIDIRNAYSILSNVVEISDFCEQDVEIHYVIHK
jgi:hypothetical protein